LTEQEKGFLKRHKAKIKEAKRVLGPKAYTEWREHISTEVEKTKEELTERGRTVEELLDLHLQQLKHKRDPKSKVIVRATTVKEGQEFARDFDMSEAGYRRKSDQPNPISRKAMCINKAMDAIDSRDYANGELTRVQTQTEEELTDSDREFIEQTAREHETPEETQHRERQERIKQEQENAEKEKAEQEAHELEEKLNAQRLVSIEISIGVLSIKHQDLIEEIGLDNVRQLITEMYMRNPNDVTPKIDANALIKYLNKDKKKKRVDAQTEAKKETIEFLRSNFYAFMASLNEDPEFISMAVQNRLIEKAVTMYYAKNPELTEPVYDLELLRYVVADFEREQNAKHKSIDELNALKDEVYITLENAYPSFVAEHGERKIKSALHDLYTKKPKATKTNVDFIQKYVETYLKKEAKKEKAKENAGAEHTK
jgi:hypothetical protein